MPQVTVVADDLTGGNATGAGYARRGLRTVTVPHGGDACRFADRCDTLVIDTASRHLPPEEATARVREAARAGAGAEQYVKRIDTTLRGNVAVEAAALLAAVGDERGGAVRALVVPAFPASGRVTVGGLQLVDGVPLAETAAARDVLSPVTETRVASILRTQHDFPVSEITLDVVTGEPGSLEEALAAVDGMAVVDATDETHLRAVALAAARVQAGGGPRWVSVDSGPFGAELAAALGLGGEGGRRALLAVAGSVTATTARQIDVLVERMGAAVVEVDTATGESDDEAERLVEACASAEVVVLRPATREGEPIAVSAETAERVPAILGRLARGALDHGAVGGVYVTGGDTTAGLLAAVGADALAVLEEVLPLAVSGHVVGGPHDGLPIVTKGGLIGAETAAVACVEHLRTRAAGQSARTEPTAAVATDEP